MPAPSDRPSGAGSRTEAATGVEAGTVLPYRIVTVAGRRVACLDSGGSGPVLLALHGHFGRGRIFEPLCRALAGRYRVIAPDQRAHGLSDPAEDLSPEAYADEAAALLDALGIPHAAVLGHSMGGAVAFVLAARAPERVDALLVADMTVLNQEPETVPVLDCSGWPRRAPGLAALRSAVEALGIPDAGYFLESAHECEDGRGWGFRFDTDAMLRSQRAFEGDLSAHWRASRQPALLLRAEHSFILTAETARRMAAERPGTELEELPGCGHWLYADDPEGFAEAIGSYLDRTLN
ncbi:alpha/beta fold hydrolase [Streptomyces iconiensis]|uniref:Alpha/beta hydrolase n=1 Tax=Streptomyces iconiensis TaxID=1384038 RepID=A0ABT6ZRU0_9ACTN|nr:alpha/beta hydrolase [Streptomyces iconiensis]MDJ1131351.1 alpha/beta hydrolase [Streptomyces iconiensis]